MRYLVLVTLFTIAFGSFANFSYLRRSPEGVLMGDAYTAVADDENTLFYNPAALGRHKGVTLVPLNPSVFVTDVFKKDRKRWDATIDERYEDLPESPEGIANRIVGTPLHIYGSLSPSIKMEHFGFSVLVANKAEMILENSIHPALDIDYRLDQGFIFGYAFPLNPSTFLGIAAKNIHRRGLQGSFDLFDTELIRLTEDTSDYKDIIYDLGYAKGKAWGVDIGLEHIIKRPGEGQFVLGTSFLNVGEMHFREEDGRDGRIPDQESSLNFGVSYLSSRSLLFEYALALDYKNAIDPIGSTTSKLSIGTRFSLPLLTAYLGYNGGHFSYGIGFDIAFVKIVAGFYGVETGYRYKQREGKRAVVLVNLFEGNFDL